jgi:Ni,Fe-hydrogenase maturation factor
MNVLCFGSSLVRKDRLAHEIADALSGKLDGFVFVKCNSYDDLVAHEKDEFVIVDVAEGIGKPRWLSRSELRDYKRYSSHDLDLGFYLKLLKPRARIFGIPAGMKKADALKAVRMALSGIKEAAK